MNAENRITLFIATITASAPPLIADRIQRPRLIRGLDDTDRHSRREIQDVIPGRVLQCSRTARPGSLNIDEVSAPCFSKAQVFHVPGDARPLRITDCDNPCAESGHEDPDESRLFGGGDQVVIVTIDDQALGEGCR